jgi:hypothetical protein
MKPPLSRGFAPNLCRAAMALCLFSACSSGPRLEPVNAETAPPEVTTPVEPLPPPQTSEEAPAMEAAVAPAPEDSEEEDGISFTLHSEPLGADPQTVVIHDAAAEGSAHRSLAEVAAEVRKSREGAASPIVVIDDESLADYADVEITVSDIRTSSDEPDAATKVDLEELAAREEHWRSAVRGVRERWRTAYDSIERLEGRVAELRRRFYSEDDPYYRDSQIKPAWDHAIEDLAAARDNVDQAQVDLTELLEAGRQEGAFPGWLREGIELEPPIDRPRRPQDRSVEDAGLHHAGEPSTTEARDTEDGGGG